MYIYIKKEKDNDVFPKTDLKTKKKNKTITTKVLWLVDSWVYKTQFRLFLKKQKAN